MFDTNVEMKPLQIFLLCRKKKSFKPTQKLLKCSETGLAEVDADGLGPVVSREQ